VYGARGESFWFDAVRCSSAGVVVSSASVNEPEDEESSECVDEEPEVDGFCFSRSMSLRAAVKPVTGCPALLFSASSCLDDILR
jgi:hypothetical protein